LDTDIGRGYELHREAMNMDILIEDKKNERYIIIENKIRSGVNGIMPDGKTQLDVYYKRIENRVDEKGWKIENSRFFIFKPDYNSIEDVSAPWKIIKYSQIFDFFKRIVHEYKHLFTYHFINALSRHTSRYPDQIFEDMHRKFIEKIKTT
jgi:hypothetical protein